MRRKTVKVTRQQIGVALGILIGLLLVPAIMYGISAFILWEPNPALWSVESRTVAVVSVIVVYLVRLFFPRFMVTSDEPETSR